MPFKRKNTSHKGNNGKVLIVGGNELYHGAPILAGLGAEKSGADLVYLMVPVNQQNLARQFSLNLIVDTFKGKFLRPVDIQHVVDWTKKADVMVIGNGLGEKGQTIRAVKKILDQSTCDLVIDASALSAVLLSKNLNVSKRQIVLTPHQGEFSKTFKANLEKLSAKELQDLLKKNAKEFGSTIVLKGPEDLIASPDGKFHKNKTGHPIMTKGGTGDVLAGLIGGFISQGLSGFEAAKKATEEWGKVGESVFKKKGFMVSVEELL